MHEYDMNAVDFTVYITVICGHNCVLLKGHADLNDTSEYGLLSRVLLCYVFKCLHLWPHIIQYKGENIIETWG